MTEPSPRLAGMPLFYSVCERIQRSPINDKMARTTTMTPIIQKMLYMIIFSFTFMNKWRLREDSWDVAALTPRRNIQELHHEGCRPPL